MAKLPCEPLTDEEIEQRTLELRLEWGDTDPEYIILQDAEYRILINKFWCRGESSLARNVGLTIASKMAWSSVRERVGQEERYGQEAFENYFKILEKKLKDPAFGMIAPIAYFGGTYRDVSEYYATSPEFTWSGAYRGSDTGQPMWRGQRIYKVNGEIIEPYENMPRSAPDSYVDHFLPEDDRINGTGGANGNDSV